MTDPIKLHPFVHRGFVLMHCNGVDFEMAPMQLFISEGGPALRIGRNMIFFNPDGTLDGSECKPGTYVEGSAQEQLASKLCDAYDLQTDNRNQAPLHAYFSVGTKGWVREVSAWPDPAPAVATSEPGESGPSPVPPESTPAATIRRIILGLSISLERIAQSGVTDDLIVIALQYLAASGSVRLATSRDDFLSHMASLYDDAADAFEGGATLTH